MLHAVVPLFCFFLTVIDLLPSTCDNNKFNWDVGILHIVFILVFLFKFSIYKAMYVLHIILGKVFQAHLTAVGVEPCK